MSFLDSLFEGMDTPGGFFSGVGSFASLMGPFFPMFTDLKRIFPSPEGWGNWESVTIATFICLGVKTFMHVYGHEFDVPRTAVAYCGALWLFALLTHYPTKYPDVSPPPVIDHDVMALLIYAALFAIPTFAFTAMQLRAAKQHNGP